MLRKCFCRDHFFSTLMKKTDEGERVVRATEQLWLRLSLPPTGRPAVLEGKDTGQTPRGRRQWRGPSSRRAGPAPLAGTETPGHWEFKQIPQTAAGSKGSRATARAPGTPCTALGHVGSSSQRQTACLRSCHCERGHRSMHLSTNFV